MMTINRHTLLMIADYLEEYSKVFGHFLDQKGIEPSEADVIITDLRASFVSNRELPIIDRKFDIIAANATNGKTYTSHNAVLLCAKDKAVPAALQEYLVECARLGANQEHLTSIGMLIERVMEYQAATEIRVPDTIGKEIDRCIHGNGI